MNLLNIMSNNLCSGLSYFAGVSLNLMGLTWPEVFNHKYLKYPRLVLMDFVFFALSSPRKMIFCPVGLYTYCMGLTLGAHRSLAPSASIAHAICSNTDSRRVFPTLRNTTALLKTPSFASCIIPSTISTEMKEDLVEPRPPETS